MRWSEQAWQAILPTYESILNLNFIRGLMEGTLPQESFRFYIEQDSIYLKTFGRILSGIAAKLDNIEHSSAFIAFAGESMSAERALHKSFFSILGDSDTLNPSPSCLMYTSYLVRQLSDASIESTLASVLPCFWVYKKVGDYILENQTNAKNQYQDWIDAYASEDYAKVVKKVIAICDEVAEGCNEKQRSLMTDSFVLCTKMEWMFWDSSFRLEQWPV